MKNKVTELAALLNSNTFLPRTGPIFYLATCALDGYAQFQNIYKTPGDNRFTKVIRGRSTQLAHAWAAQKIVKP